MLENLDFYYNDISSQSMGLVNVRIEAGLFEESFLPSRNIEEVSIRGNDKPYFQSVKLSPLEFDLTFAFVDDYTDDKLREVARWLNQGYYKPFYFAERPDRIFYCMPNGDSKISHNGNGQGYITLKMKCDSPFGYTPQFTTATYTSTSTTNWTTFTFNNIGDVECYPEIYITKKGTGDVEVLNETTNTDFLLTSLADKENIYVDCNREIIKTDIPLTYRYDKFNDNYLFFNVGTNSIKLKGTFDIYFVYYFKTLV